MKAIFKSTIKNNYVYQGLRKELTDDGYTRIYLREYYLFGIKIRSHLLDENVEVKVKIPDKKEIGFNL